MFSKEVQHASQRNSVKLKCYLIYCGNLILFCLFNDRRRKPALSVTRKD